MVAVVKTACRVRSLSGKNMSVCVFIKRRICFLVVEKGVGSLTRATVIGKLSNPKKMCWRSNPQDPGL